MKKIRQNRHFIIRHKPCPLLDAQDRQVREIVSFQLELGGQRPLGQPGALSQGMYIVSNNILFRSSPVNLHDNVLSPL